MAYYSIIIPTYNSGKTLSATLDSVLEQTFLDFEVLIMDGLSTDNTIAIAQSYHDERICIYSEKDNGVYDAMNKGIVKASGDWLYFLGSDDEFYDTQVLSTLFDTIKTNKYDFVYGDAWFVKNKYRHIGEVNRERLMRETNICHQAIFYKKQLFNTLGVYNLDFKIWADWDFNIRCFSLPHIKIKFVDYIICKYNDYSGLSAQTIIDNDFMKLLPLEIKEKKILDDFRFKSLEWRIGYIFLHPYAWFKHKFLSK